MLSSLREVHEGMKVFDFDHHEIGKVDWVRFGADDPTTPEVEAATPAEEPEDDSVIDILARAFRTDDIPEELRERLMEQGFVRIDADGLFAGERYVMPEQISSVDNDGIVLKVKKDQLYKRPY
jgi:hypothetical protein